MATLVAAKAGPMHLSKHGKLLVAKSMYSKGTGFLGAAVLLDQKKGQDWPVLHLLCQGLEIILKGLLLMQDYDKYLPQLKNKLGHDLEAAASATSKAFHLHPPKGAFLHELQDLNKLYKKHVLRYGVPLDIVVDPRTIPTGRVFRRIAAVFRLVEREVARWRLAT